MAVSVLSPGSDVACSKFFIVLSKESPARGDDLASDLKLAEAARSSTYRIGDLPLATPTDDLETVFSEFSNGVEPDVNDPNHRVLFAAYLSSRFSHAGRFSIESLVNNDLAPLLREPEAKQTVFGRAKVSSARRVRPAGPELVEFTSRLLRAAGQARSSLFEIDANLGYWRRLLGLKSIAASSEAEAAPDSARQILLAGIGELIDLPTRDAIRDSKKSDPTTRATLLFHTLQRLAERPGADLPALNAAMRQVVSLAGFFDATTVASLRSDEADDRIQGLQALLSARDRLAISLGFAGHAQELFARHPTPQETFLPEDSEAQSLIANFLRQAESAPSETRATGERVVRQLSLAESGFRFCLAESDCATGSYFRFAGDRDFVYFTETDARGRSHGHATLALGTVDGRPAAFLDKVQGVSFEEGPGFVEAVRQILGHSGFSIYAYFEPGDHNGLSNDVAFTRHLFNHLLFVPQRFDSNGDLERFKFRNDGVSFSWAQNYSRAMNRPPVQRLLPMAGPDLPSIEFRAPPKPQRLALSVWAAVLFKASAALKDGNESMNRLHIVAIAFLISPFVEGAEKIESKSILFDDKAIAKAYSTGSPLLERKDFRILAAHRDGPGQVEIHSAEADILICISGEAEFVTGGSAIDAKPAGANELRGTSITGGRTQFIKAGDILVIPAGEPHWFRRVISPVQYSVVKIPKNRPLDGAVSL